MSSFRFAGQYRVQSYRDFANSSLAGEWYIAPGLISRETINAALSASPMWTGTSTVNLCPALIRERQGKFSSEPDILYKRDYFIPEDRSLPMTWDIVDVRKSAHYWKNRTPYLISLLGDDTYQNLLGHFQQLDLTIANEYMLHEAGHFIAYDVNAKQRDGYFKPRGKTAWPLIYLEELRADLNAFGFSLQVLPAEEAVGVFLYTIFLRFGVHREGLVNHRHPYGLVPFLLFCVLLDLGFVSVVKQHGRYVLKLENLSTKYLTEIVSACTDHANTAFNTPELTEKDPLTRTIVAAQYLRQQVERKEQMNLFSSLMNQPFGH